MSVSGTEIMSLITRLRNLGTGGAQVGATAHADVGLQVLYTVPTCEPA